MFMFMNDASQQWQEKWIQLDFLQKVKFKEAENEDCYYWTLSKSKNNIEIDVVIELDKKGYCGIYYGCRAKEKNKQELISPTFNIPKIKDDYFTNYWSIRNPSNSREDVEKVFLLDDGHTGKANGEYWPFWIRLEEKYSIKEAVIASQVLIESLKNQGCAFN